ncbi:MULTISPECIES: N-acyl-D-amino-acid deacylase family protein [unclassified Brevundimonas]|uniref:N-acyl-D-amino-acid deacylase family protein n=1 Tax=unclassified Brevundimonas TaxID=2622653 RepID=UPI003F9274EC
MKRFTLGAAALVAALAVSPVSRAQAQEPFDLLIRGGLVFDGGRSEPVLADVGVLGDRIVLVGAAPADSRAREVIDARGLWVTPGFIDPHTHYLADLMSADAGRRSLPAALLQGVTTVFVGNDGTSSNNGVGAMFEWAGTNGIGPNLVSYVGFGTVRRQVMGETDRPPTADEQSRMAALVATAMCEGAMGLSTGLFYAPQNYAATDEVTALAREAARRGGIYDTHLRDESSYGAGLEAAVQEAIDIGRGANIPVHIAHIKALGVDVHGQAPAIIDRIEAAQRDGLTVHADQYPWDASGTALAAALLPRWAQADGEAALMQRLDDLEQSVRIRQEMADNLRRRGGAESLLLTAGAPREVRGLTLGQAALLWTTDPVEAAIRVLRAGGSSVASFNQTEADIRAFMQRPWVMTSSDASAGHPRRYASFARLYDLYVRREGVLSPQAFVHRSTGLTAETFGLAGRGRLQPGAYADIAVFDAERFSPQATYLEPERPAEGMVHVVVNGRRAVADGRMTDILSGRSLPRDPGETCRVANQVMGAAPR